MPLKATAFAGLRTRILVVLGAFAVRNTRGTSPAHPSAVRPRSWPLGQLAGQEIVFDNVALFYVKRVVDRFWRATRVRADRVTGDRVVDRHGRELSGASTAVRPVAGCTAGCTLNPFRRPGPGR